MTQKEEDNEEQVDEGVSTNYFNYTTDALLYQDALRYCIYLNDLYPDMKFRYPPFTIWELTGWLIDNNRDFLNYYKGLSTRTISKSNRIASRKDTIEGLVNDFIKLGLIKVWGQKPASRGNEITNIYRFTSAGNILAQIIKGFDPTKQKIANEHIYFILDNHFESYRLDKLSSNESFCQALFRKCEDKGVFGDLIVNQLLYNKLHSNIPIRNFQQLFDSSILILKDIDSVKLYSDIWFETLDEMADDVKMLLMHQIKIDMEDRMQLQSKYPKGYEKLRFDLRDKYDVLAIEGVCTSCNLPSPIQIGIMEYLESINPIVKKYPKCPRCNIENNSMIIPHITL